jgi:NAD(P)H-nitrite reductase large subunit
MSEISYDYLLVGNSTAAIAAVESIRRHDQTGTLAVVSGEDCAAYCAPLISYLLAGKITADQMPYRPADFYEKLRVTTHLGRTVTEVRPQEHQVVLDDGSLLGYGKLLLACGGTPILSNLPGADLGGVFTFTRYADVDRVQSWVQERHALDAVVIGGGMIGVKAAEALEHLGLRTSIVELLDRVLAQALDERGSALAQRALEQAGLRVLTGRGAAALEGQEGRVTGVRLDNGDLLPAQIVIMAIGVRPNVRLGAAAGVSVNRGVLVDDHLRTTLPDVYAAGDVTEGYDVLLGESRPVAIWPSAFLQGQVAGANMAGADESFDGSVAMNSIQVCGLPTISVGLTDPAQADEILEYNSPDSHAYRRLFLRGDRIIGAVFVGDIDRAGIITGLIREGIDVSEFKQKLIGRDLGLLSLPKEYRKHKVMGPGIEV